MFEVLASIDPTTLPLWAVLLFAAGMYPVGMFLPCSLCCDPCSCLEGQLPDTLTVTFSGLPDQTPGPPIIGVSISACFGSGATARITAPGGDRDTDAGPISEIVVLNAGSGYAKLGRVSPTVSASSSGTGSGAEFTASLESDTDECGVDYWAVESISVSGGTGYSDGDQVTFEVADGDTAESHATATIHTTRNEPTLSASAAIGSGASLEILYSANAGPPETWSIDSVSVTDGGSGYIGGSELTIALGDDDVEVSPAFAVIRTSRSEPALVASVLGSAGSGAEISVGVSPTYDELGDAWTVSSLTIDNGGTGYAEYEEIAVFGDGFDVSGPGFLYAYVTAVDENGAITAVEVYYGGVYWKEEGVIVGVEVYSTGEYYKDDGIPVSVSVQSGGVYYREDASADPYVADVSIALSNTLGTGAVLTASVDDNTSSPGFGSISSIAIENGGDDYLAWEWKNTKCCGWYWDDKPVVVQKASLTANYPCELTFTSCFGSGAAGRVALPGETIWSGAGPIEGLLLQSGGSGYAMLARVEPAIQAFAFPGSGATFSIGLQENADECGVPWWSIASVAVDNPGSGYEHGDTMQFYDDSRPFDSVNAIISIATSQPTLAAAPPSGGSGASLTVATEPLGTTPETWRISSVSVGSGGSGYSDNTQVTATPTGASVQKTAAVLRARTNRLQPTLSATVSTASGSGASLTPILFSTTDGNGNQIWSVSGYTINNSGSGYLVNESLVVTATDGQTTSTTTSSIDGIGSGGAITSVRVISPGAHFKNGGQIERIQVLQGGVFYQDDGIASVALQSPGYFYREDSTLPPIVADVTVGFSGSCPGSGAVITPKIGDTVGSPTFGRITELEIDSPGDGYVAGDFYRRPAATNPACYWFHRMCSGWSRNGPGLVEVDYYGPSTPPRVRIRTEVVPSVASDTPALQTCDTTFTANATLENCGSWDALEFAAVGGATASVQAGGEYDVFYKRTSGPTKSLPEVGVCDQCCQGEEEPPAEITVTLDRDRYGDTSLSGDYVLAWTGNSLRWNFANESIAISIFLRPGRCQAGDSEECDNCIKKCEAIATLSILGDVDVDMRECAAEGADDPNAALCNAYCTEDTPICSPSGLEFRFYDPFGADARLNPAEYWGRPLCEPNVESPNHLDVAILTVQ